METHDPTIQCVLVIGLGRIGLPQALTLAHDGLTVYGFDRSPSTVSALMRAEVPFDEPMMAEYLKKTMGKMFFPLATWSELSIVLPKIDAILFTVGTQAPSVLDATNNEPFELGAYFSLFDQLITTKPRLKKGIKFIIRTTLPLGSTDRLKHYLESKHAIREGDDFFLAFVPERITEGCAINELKRLPKIIGVYSEKAFKPISGLFQSIGGKIIRVRDPLTAEFCKLTDNSFRSTLFSYANEIAMYASELNINAQEVIDAVNEDYQRNHIPQPGFVSGYCLSKDPYIFELNFLKNKSNRSFHSVWYYGRKTNDFLNDFIVKKVIDCLKLKENPCVALLGLSFKEDVDDFRMSHALVIMNQLINHQITQLKVYDPNLDKNKYTTLPQALSSYIVEKCDSLNQTFLTEVDAIIICNNHQPILALNELRHLTALLKHTHKPCYLFDVWRSWTKAIDISHIHYENLSFKNSGTHP